MIWKTWKSRSEEIQKKFCMCDLAFSNCHPCNYSLSLLDGDGEGAPPLGKNLLTPLPPPRKIPPQ